ncbi:DUF2235 domain-containing protein [Endozoicomonas sp. SM1973]|uniref:DUF2235 domain-containing protein n=1 Tax=Spartinivicinus marinus TaxID=2994442 RepID=A0A853I5M9_9GAMM|nr:DUF2235 domain-containing protein [Spartinivicinus marinus]MCX4026691.1 DUF2235 domain-containing protein [Spartinivicinus marinus]NYZ64525.1 DUF2235 domain-containing protein [Spartinivicinus marinus]
MNSNSKTQCPNCNHWAEVHIFDPRAKGFPGHEYLFIDQQGNEYNGTLSKHSIIRINNIAAGPYKILIKDKNSFLKDAWLRPVWDDKEEASFIVPDEEKDMPISAVQDMAQMEGKVYKKVELPKTGTDKINYLDEFAKTPEEYYELTEQVDLIHDKKYYIELKPPLTEPLWISCFFDGTGNSLVYDKILEKMTNVGKLYCAHVGETRDEFRDADKRIKYKYHEGMHCYALYYRGVGSDPNSKIDEVAGGGFGLGTRERVDYIKEQVTAIFDLHVNSIQKDISAFGFSRGSSAARAFSWEVNKDDINSDKYETLVRLKIPGQSPIVNTTSRDLNTYVTLKHKFTQKFLGIFDSVTSIGLDPDNIEFGIDFEIHEKIERVVHFIAAHERRGKFDLQSIRLYNTWTQPVSGKWLERMYPGVHADVGGGYYPGEQGKSNELARIPLNDMYDEAIKVDVPLDTLEVLKTKKLMSDKEHQESKIIFEKNIANKISSIRNNSNKSKNEINIKVNREISKIKDDFSVFSLKSIWECFERNSEMMDLFEKYSDEIKKLLLRTNKDNIQNEIAEHEFLLFCYFRLSIDNVDLIIKDVPDWYEKKYEYKDSLEKLKGELNEFYLRFVAAFEPEKIPSAVKWIDKKDISRQHERWYDAITHGYKKLDPEIYKFFLYYIHDSVAHWMFSFIDARTHARGVFFQFDPRSVIEVYPNE